MTISIVSSIVLLCLSKVLAQPTTEKKVSLKHFDTGSVEGKPKDLFVIQEEAKVLLERDQLLKPQFVAIIHNKFPHPTFPGERAPWFQVYVYSDFFKGMPLEERKKHCKLVIAEKLFEAGFHRVSFNCLTMEEDQRTVTPFAWEVGGPTTPRSAESEYEGPMMKQYRAVLEKNFKLHHIEIIDTSETYHLPVNSEKYLTILLVSDQFENKSEYEREQMVINALKKDMPWDIRGLALIPFSIYEYEKAPDMISQNKLKKVAAILHTKYLIHAQGHLNKTTTLTWEQHYKKMEKVAERVYGSVGDKNVKDCSHSEYRDLVDDYNEYVEDRYVKNEKHYMDRLAEMRKARLISNEEAMKKDPLIKDLKKMWTLTSYEKNMQEFDSVGERFNIDPMVDLERVTPNKYYYEDQPEENLATVFV